MSLRTNLNNSTKSKSSDRPGWQMKLHEIIFEADTPAGKMFDVVLIALIVLSVLAVMLDSIQQVRQRYGSILYLVEWSFTVLFSIEYMLRLVSVGRPIRYATSFYGIVDLLAVLPTYLSLVFPGTQYLLVIRILRVLRIFRIFKLAHYMGEGRVLLQGIRASQKKITVFLFAVLTIVVIVGSLMYLIEGETQGFTSIPRSIYWTIVTLTTVGYGDISPKTSLGQAIAAMVMIMGYGIIAVPTGIVTVEMSRVHRARITTQSCPQCSAEGHDPDAKFCKYCGASL